MGGKNKKPKQRVTEYYMTVHYGICQGPVGTLSRIKINEKVAWQGRAGSDAKFLIANTGLFGGNKKEGGVLGDVYYNPGSFTQRMASFVAAKYGRTPTTMTGYRGIATAMFTDRPGISPQRGFYWAANQPFVPAAEFNVTRIFSGWRQGFSTILDDPTAPRSLYISIDDSGSMSGSKLASMKTSMLAVLDDIQLALQNGLQLDLAVQKWSDVQDGQVSFQNVTVAQLNTIRTFINGFNASGGGTNFDAAAQGAVTHFTTSLSRPNLEKRVWVFITDGDPFPVGADDTARATASDLLDQSSGSFSVENGTAVDCYGINIEIEDTSATAKLDNTAIDGVPVVSSSDPSGLQGAVQAALFGGVPAQMNPAHIIYECLTNRVWGMGAPTSVIDDASFTAAAQVLFNERFGVSLMWAEQTEIESFVQEVLDHIEANLYVSPATGKFVLKLIRGDYDEATLPVLDETNCEVVSYTRRSPGEVINEINLTWTNPDNEKEEVLTIQDLGAIVANGGEIISDSRNYYGVRNRTLAWQLAQRDISTATAPLATVEIEVNRVAWDFGPGDVFKLTAEEHGADEEVMRVVKIDYGTTGDSTIKINATQDIFSFQRPEYEEPPQSVFEDPSQPPSPITDVVPMSLNYYLGLELIATLGTQTFPDSYVALLATTENTDGQDYELFGEEVDATGTTSVANLGTRSFVSRAQLAQVFPFQAETVTTGFTSFTPVGSSPVQGSFALIGDDGLEEEEYELCLILSFDGANYTIRRGILDTIPRAWPVGTQIRFFDTNTAFLDQESRGAGVELDYQVVMNTSQGQGGLGQSPIITYTPQERLWAPSRPANVVVEGTTTGTIDATALTTVDCTWANRNRITEDAQPLSFTAASVTPEVGQTTVIEFYNDAAPGAPAYNSISIPEGDTSYSIPIAEFAGAGVTTIKFRSSREGILSFSGIERKVITTGGYGNAYGLDYGGSA